MGKKGKAAFVMPTVQEVVAIGLCEQTADFLATAIVSLREDGITEHLEMAHCAALGHEIACRATAGKYGRMPEAVNRAAIQVVLMADYFMVPYPMEVSPEGTLVDRSVEAWKASLVECQRRMLQWTEEEFGEVMRHRIQSGDVSVPA